MEKTVIRNAYVASQDPLIGNQADLDILIEGNQIAAVGRDLEVGDAAVVDATGCIVMPGFVDAHRHIWQGAIRGVCADWSIMDYATRIRMNAARFFTPEDMYAAQLQGSLEALNAGVTTLTDYCHNILTPDHAHEAIRGSAESGMRAVWNYGFNFPPSESPHFKSLDQRVAFLDEIAAGYFSSPDNLLTLGVAPEEAMFAGSPEALTRQINAARNVGAHMFWHANSGPRSKARHRETWPRWQSGICWAATSRLSTWQRQNRMNGRCWQMPVHRLPSHRKRNYRWA